jgi:RNase P subunit RPR2
MDATLIRQLIQRRLWDGRLPHENSVELSCGPGTRQTCDGCGTPILPRETMTVRVDAEDWREMRFHLECFEIWDDERRKVAHRKLSHSS